MKQEQIGILWINPNKLRKNLDLIQTKKWDSDPTIKSSVVDPDPNWGSVFRTFLDPDPHSNTGKVSKR